MCVRGEELSVGTKLGFTKWGLTKVTLSIFQFVNFHQLRILLKNILWQITASVTEANGMVHSADGETRELAVASLERSVAHLQRAEKAAARLDMDSSDQLDP